MRSLLLIAARNVLRNRRRSLITFSAIFLALTVMVAIRGFLNGLQESIRENVVFGQTGALQVHKKGFLKSVALGLDFDVPSDPAFLARITAVPGVVAATPRIMFGGMVNSGDITAFAMISAIDPVRELLVCPRRSDMISSGRSLAESRAASGILTPELLGNIGVKVGGKATLLTNDREGVMNALDFDVAGAYGQPGLPLPDKKFGFVPIGFAQALLRMEGRATEIAVAVRRLDDVPRLQAALQAALGPEYEVSTWHDMASFLDDAFATQNTLLGIIGAIFLFVALLGIANTMLMSVYERTREIGTMMAVGVRRRQIIALFLLEAALLGLAGGLLGAGAGGAFVVYYGHHGMVLKFPSMSFPIYVYPKLSVGYVVSILVLAAAGAAVASLWPAGRASRLRPVEALGSV